MKIIGETADKGLLLSASKDEVANLLGFYSEYSGREGMPDLKPGLVIKINAMYKQLRELATAHQKALETIAVLRGLADVLEIKCPVIQEISTPKDQPNG